MNAVCLFYTSLVLSGINLDPKRKSFDKVVTPSLKLFLEYLGESRKILHFFLGFFRNVRTHRHLVLEHLEYCHW